MPMETRELLQILACPKCLGNLVALEDNGSVAAFACKACGVVYPQYSHHACGRSDSY